MCYRLNTWLSYLTFIKINCTWLKGGGKEEVHYFTNNKNMRNNECEIYDSESLDESPILTRFATDYDKWSPNLQARCSWEQVQAKLLANDGRYLELAENMNERGVLFGVDEGGNPLIADGGEEPIMRGMNYKDTRDRVLYEHDRLDKLGKMVLGENGEPIPTGYEMFPFSGNYDRSSEIQMFEVNTGRRFIESSSIQPQRYNNYTNSEYIISWLESGENPDIPRVVIFGLYLYTPFRSGYAYVGAGSPKSASQDCGVRRLLRLI